MTTAVLMRKLVAQTDSVLRRCRRRCAPLFPVMSKARNVSTSLFMRRKRRAFSTRFSLVVACYNVDHYIDDFFRSVFSQNVDLDVHRDHRG